MHLVWDWNGTLLNDLDLVVRATNEAFASVSGTPISADEHRRRFRRPISEFYAEVLGRVVEPDEFNQLDKVFHTAYRDGLMSCELVEDAQHAIRSWPGTQSLLSMWFHHELVPAVGRYGLTEHFVRVDGLPATDGGGLLFKAEHLANHLAEIGVAGADTVLIGDSLDDADAAGAVGARVVLFGGGFTDPERLRASGRPVATSLSEAVAMARTEAGLPG